MSGKPESYFLDKKYSVVFIPHLSFYIERTESSDSLTGT